MDARAVVRGVLRVLNEFDFAGVRPGSPGGPPDDEYQNEALAIASLLVNHGSVDRPALSAIWLKWFADDLSGVSERRWEDFIESLNAMAR